MFLLKTQWTRALSRVTTEKTWAASSSVDNSCIFLFVIVSTRFFLYFVTTSRDCFFNKYPRVLFKTIRRWQNKLAWTRVFLPWKIRRCPRSGLLKIRFCLFSFSFFFFDELTVALQPIVFTTKIGNIVPCSKSETKAIYSKGLSYIEPQMSN